MGLMLGCLLLGKAGGGARTRTGPAMCHLFFPPGSLLSADMAESSSPPSPSAVALAPEPGVTEQPVPRSPPPSPPGLEEPLDGVDPDIPHPDLAPVAFFCLRQTTSPRNWCIKMVCNPYPLCGLELSGPCLGPSCPLREPCLSHLPLVRRSEAAGAWTVASELTGWVWGGVRAWRLY